VGEKFSAPVQTGPWAHPTSFTMGTGLAQGLSGWGVPLTTHSHLQGGSNMTGTDLCVNKLHCAAAVRP